MESKRKPQTLKDFQEAFPEVWKAYAKLRDACDGQGPLNPKMRELIKIAVEASRGRHGGLVAHLHRAREAGATREEILHAIVLAAPLLGLPDILDAFVTVRDHLQ